MIPLLVFTMKKCTVLHFRNISVLSAGVNVYVWGAGTCSEDKMLPPVWPAQLAATEDRLLGHGDHVHQLLRLRSGQDTLTILIILYVCYFTLSWGLSEDEAGGCEKVGQGRRLSSPGSSNMR